MKKALVAIAFVPLVMLIILVVFFLPKQPLKQLLAKKKKPNFEVDVTVRTSVLKPDVEAYFKHLFNDTRFSGAVLVAHKGKVIYKQSNGWKNYAKRDSIRTSSVFQLASVSKQFTAMAVVLLKQKGQIKYADPIQKYLPEFPYSKITIHHMLCHQAGLQNYMYFAENLRQERTQLNNWQVLQMLNEHPKQLKPYWKAGHKFYYSNTGYAVLASLVAKVSEQKFSNFMQENFFTPAQMQNTYIGKDSVPSSLLAKGHYYNRREVLPFYQDPVVGDKSAYSTIEDIYRWDRLLHAGTVFQKAELDTAFMFHSKAPNSIKGYGYGWRLWHYPDGRKIEYHTGWYRGYTALFVRIRETDSTIIILSNLVNRSFMRTYHNLVDVLYQP